ncbi:UDP-N-acetylmuramoyl-L-alanyl-D-glutamate--2,6-diaminopimelate ligase [Dialister sp.]|uniref:UDP-N-acetylmuramoyl-L-alanyl-D-glutamate--2, 6-diaminopimelate ligase n=1 Tax=Dialister sp. TaxID=1955814 RepID=UPI002E7FCCD1|nr:UDP-N-acetylmuramoyl-L-alanyl-D-glutamate--2,6-diaminopimelate ligase [Dialister sp.]MEE3452097.1 UDP-N-acetylmuramoyl-L-alanyl-D-glutamate--2,6-diaminopimelate ligase [Dialister sp.]
MKKLSDLAAMTPVVRVQGNMEVFINDITADSRQVVKGGLFICLSGAHVDGHDFVSSAVNKGASAIVAEKEVNVPDSVTVLYVKDTRQAMEDMVPYFFDYPSRNMRMIALTGTNGKTTTTHVAAHILHHAGFKTGVIGTIHALIGDRELPTHNTTPDVIDLERLLAQMAEENVTHVCMEVSSHSLVLGRVRGCEFDDAVFTNLTEDHLDFHKTMDNYAKAKAILFNMVSSEGQHKTGKSAWINKDDPYAHVMAEGVKNRNICKLHTYSMLDPSADLYAYDSRFTGKSSSFKLKYDGEIYTVETKLAGRFNIYNTLAAIGASLSEGISMKDILEAMKDFHSVPGRFELIDEGQPFAVVVDYAHTPDGLEKILTTAQEITKGKIIVVFGCGGDRDRLKRPIMGRIAARNADVAIVTSDNPRTEDPEAIVKEVAAGVEEVKKKKDSLQYEILVDRRTAINRAIHLAGPEDIVLIAGKGHEDYQILKDRTIHFDDREEARKALKEI